MGNSYPYRLIAMCILTCQSGQLIEHRHSINVVSILHFVLSAFISYYTTTDMEFDLQIGEIKEDDLVCRP